MGDDELRRLAVRREHQLQTPLKVRAIERLGRQVEVVVTLGVVERLAHGAGGVGHPLDLVDQPVEGGVHRFHRRLHAYSAHR
jgi:hypothetical protein